MAFIVPPRKNGPKAHLPVAIALDRSYSTETIRPLLNHCAEKLISSLKEDMFLRNIVELLVVQFSSDYETVVDFAPLETVRGNELDILKSGGSTATGDALLYILQRLDEKKIEWRLSGEKYYQPLLFLLTDGYPDAGLGAPDTVVEHVRQTYEAAAEQIREREANQKIVFIAAGIQQKNGYHANIEKLQELTSYPDRVLCVTDDVGGIHGIERFYDLIYQSTNAMYEGTPIEDIVRGFIDL